MFRLEILDQEEKILTSYHLQEGLTLIGKSPNANVHLAGKNIGPLQLGIKFGVKASKPELIMMDLGGPSPLKFDGKEKVESILSSDQAYVEIGNRKLRVVRIKSTLPDVRKQKWVPTVDQEKKLEKQGTFIRLRIYQSGQLLNVVNQKQAYTMKATDFNLEKDHRLVWGEQGKFYLEVPAEWISKGGRVAQGSQILKLEDFSKASEIQTNTVYRIQSGLYTIEILISPGRLSIGPGNLNPFPKELRKPFGVSALIVLGLFSLWILATQKKDVQVEEPYKVYARIQNVPIEKILQPEEPHDEAQGGGGSGSQSTQTTAPQTGGGPSKLAQSLTGGLTNLVGSMLGQVKNSNAVVAENGAASAAAAAASTSSGVKVGALANVGNDKNALAGATKLGNLGIAGSGKGFSGGSGTGLGTGVGSGIGSGVGNGIGKGSFKLIEEESIVDGGLDKSVIAAVIQNNLSQIKYCYERQLVAEPDLFGKVVVNWDINASGTVEATNIKQTTLNSAPVEQCMMSKISGWKFPMPKNGTKVHVSYPFLFKSTK